MNEPASQFRPIDIASACVAGCLLLAFPVAAWAHTEQAAAGFLAGLLHPVFGLDHFLAMLSVGIVSAQLGGRRVYTVPTVFVVAMIAGGIAGMNGVQWPYVEAGIAASVVALGISIALVDSRSRSLPVMVATAFFGSLHGFAHGAEMPSAIDPVYYAAGFVCSTASIHLLGVAIGHFLHKRSPLQSWLRYLGSATAGMGLMILIQGLSA